MRKSDRELDAQYCRLKRWFDITHHLIGLVAVISLQIIFWAHPCLENGFATKGELGLLSIINVIGSVALVSICHGLHHASIMLLNMNYVITSMKH
jgi:hypothetical protein